MWKSLKVPRFVIKRDVHRMVQSTFDTKWDPVSVLPVEIKELLQQENKSGYTYLIAFQQILNLLKTQPRTGWLNHNIAEPESISDHMYRMSMISMSLNRDKFVDSQLVDTDKCCKISLIHDLAEALVGDIVPHDANIDKIEKGKREYKTILYLSDIVSHYNPEFSKSMVELWLDYEEQRNLEAKIVKDIDKYELLLSAFQYEMQYKGEKDLTEFFSARNLIKTAEVGKIADELLKERTLFWAKFN